MARLICLSDTHYSDHHLTSLEIPEGDVLIHAGDATMQGHPGETSRFMEWMNDQPHPVKYFTPGNHDWAFEDYSTNVWGNVQVLINRWSDFTVGGKAYAVFGSPWSLRFNDWAFNVDERQMGRLFQSLMPYKMDILITHGPPHGILDYYEEEHTNKDGQVLKQGQHLGSRALRMFIHDVKPKVAIYGHVHSAHGREQVGDTLYTNVAILDDQYKVRYAPTVIDI